MNADLTLSPSITLAGTFLLSFVLGYFFIPKVCQISFERRLFDAVDDRKIHHTLIPRLGGLSFTPVIVFSVATLVGINLFMGNAALIGALKQNAGELLFGMCASMILYVVGAIDDLSTLRYRSKFTVQLLAGVMLIASGLSIGNLHGLFGLHELPVYIDYPLTLLAVMFIINAFNLIDGIDGLASGLGIVMFIFYGAAFIFSGEYLYAMLALAATGALLPFYYYNVFGDAARQHKIFMGDTGSLTIGFLLAFLSMKLSDCHIGACNPTVLAFIPLFVPCFDLLRVFFFRMRNSKGLFLPDKNHIHHRLLDAGWSQRSARLRLLALSVALTLGNVGASSHIDINLLLSADLLIWMLFALTVAYRIRRRRAAASRTAPTATIPTHSFTRYMARIKNYLFTSLLLCSLLGMLGACGSTKDIVYFQDLRPGESEQALAYPAGVTVRPGDKLSIIVNCTDPRLAELFNLSVVTRQLGTAAGRTGVPQGISGYTVDSLGCIDFPVLGKIRVQGLNREQIASHIKQALVGADLVKEPVITVEFMNLSISVLGEVKTPGRYDIDRERLTLLDAIGMAGDLTIYGKREKVLVLRQEEGVQRVYAVNLCSAQELYASPAYYLRQNDVVYVEPNQVRSRQSTVNGNNVRSSSFWISLASLITSVLVLVIRK
jgi:UDP-N-acetylmuramyl pentapeptide phosphotransferase/UDP-N-acetylglucosamine-1-phosphate transferase/protein involved in polysaccharide export with SLBB domain